MAPSRRVHVVRIYDPYFNEGVEVPNKAWVDVKVVDAVALQTPDGDEQLFEPMQSSDSEENETESENEVGSGAQERLYATGPAKPYIIDPTGDYTGPKGSFDAATRTSHIKPLTVTGDDQGNQVTIGFDVEVLDKVVLKGPNGSELLLDMSDALATRFITDTTVNSGTNDIAVPYSTTATRAQHVVTVTGSVVTTDDQGNPVSVSAKDDSPTMIIEMTDKVCIQGPNGQEFLIDLSLGNKAEPTEGTDDNIYENDTTVYISNGAEEKIPPINTDPNPYIVFPSDSASVIGFQGSLTGKALQALVPDQGLLWWIVGFGQSVKQGQPPPPPQQYTGYYILYPPTQTINLYEYEGSGPGWVQIGSESFAGPFSSEAAIATGEASGPFTSALANALLLQANEWIAAYNAAGATFEGTYPAINIAEPPGALPGVTQFILASDGFTYPPPPTDQTFLQMPLFIVASQGGLDSPPYGG